MLARGFPGPGDPVTWGPVWHPNDPRQPEPPEPSDRELEDLVWGETELALQRERDERDACDWRNDEW